MPRKPIALNSGINTSFWNWASDILASCSSVGAMRSEEHTSELQSQSNLVCRLLLEKKKEETVGFRDSSGRYFYRLSLSNIAVACMDESSRHRFVLRFSVEGYGSFDGLPYSPTSVRL